MTERPGTGPESPNQGRRSERGSVTVVAAGLLVICALLAMASADVTRALLAGSRAQTAADAAALAAAQALVVPFGGDPQTAASDYAEANGGTLMSCTCSPGSTEAVVIVAVPAGPFLLLHDPGAVTRTARAVVGAATA
jgi:secretion/DNA translocation related TadE-like protein